MNHTQLEQLLQVQRTEAYRTGRDDALALAVDLLITKGHREAAQLLRALSDRTPGGRVAHEPPTAQLPAVPAPRPPDTATGRPALHVITGRTS